jgi:hypothetical protein
MFEYLADGWVLVSNGIGENNVELAPLPLDLCQEAIEFANVGRVPSNASQFRLPVKGGRQLRTCIIYQEDVRAFIDKMVRGGQRDFSSLTRHERNFSL